MVGEQEKRRIEHIEQFGSFLHCPEKACLCAFMEENALMGRKCTRQPCIIDDPYNIALMKRQERNRMKRAIQMKRMQEEEERVAIRNQSRQGLSYEQKMLIKIQRLEEESEEAFRDSKPNRGQILFNRSQIMRGELRKHLDNKK